MELKLWRPGQREPEVYELGEGPRLVIRSTRLDGSVSSIGLRDELSFPVSTVERLEFSGHPPPPDPPQPQPYEELRLSRKDFYGIGSDEPEGEPLRVAVHAPDPELEKPQKGRR